MILEEQLLFLGTWTQLGEPGSNKILRWLQKSSMLPKWRFWISHRITFPYQSDKEHPFPLKLEYSGQRGNHIKTLQTNSEDLEFRSSEALGLECWELLQASVGSGNEEKITYSRPCTCSDRCSTIQPHLNLSLAGSKQVFHQWDSSPAKAIHPVFQLRG